MKCIKKLLARLSPNSEVLPPLPEKEEGDRPPADEVRYTRPVFLPVNARVETRGKYLTPSGMPRGLVIHYTAGRDDEELFAEDTVGWLADQGLGCFVLSRTGQLYRARNQEISDVAYHAGRSSWQGHSGISRYCMGIEVCSPGRLSDEGESWFGRDYSERQLRRFDTQTENIAPGTYSPFSAQQEHTLEQFCLWQLDVNPEFSIDWIVGHDEVSPGRKTDPGGSLSRTMPEFRDYLRFLSL